MTRTSFILSLLFPLAAAAQQPLILLDPARGGADSGARVADRVPEKQVTLDLAGRLASLLRARGFAVEMTREADVDVSSDARAAMANNTHPIACILLYAAPSGSGVHLYTSSLRQNIAAGAAVRWDEAQAPYADRSRTLAADLRTAIEHGRVTASVGRTWMRPLDNMQCPAVAVEMLPESNGTTADDSGYQSHVANAVANTLLQWRAKVAATMPPPPQPVAPATPIQKPVTQQAEPTAAQPAARPDAAVPASPAATKPPTTPTVAPGGSAPSAGEAPPCRMPAVPRMATSAPVVRQPPAQPGPTQPKQAQPDRTEP